MKIMKKKFLFIVAALVLFVPNAMAAEKTVATDAEFIEAFKTAETNDVIKLTANITFNDHLQCGNGKKLTVNLNGFNLTATDGKTIIVQNGELTFTGKGIIDVKDSIVNVWGIEDSTSTSKSILNIDKDVTIKSNDSGIAVFYDEKNAYNTEVNFAGKIQAVNLGITVNGTIKHENGPVINIKNGASITTTADDGVALYGAGRGTYTIEEGAYLEGATGVEVRAGILNVKGGTIVGTGKELVSKPNGNGATTQGAGIAVVQHTTLLPIDVTISGGNVKGVKALYVNNTQQNPAEAWEKVKVTVEKGTFNTEVDKAYLAETTTLEQSGNNYVVKPNVKAESEGVKFESDDAFSNEYTLVVAPKTEKEVKDVTTKLTEAYKDNKKVTGLKLISLHEISMYLDNEVVPMENGKYTISIPVAKDLRNFKNYKVIYVNEAGEIQETIDAKLVDGKVVFTTTHLSTYGVIGYNNPTMNPETSDNIVTYAVILCASIFALGSAVTLRKRYN